MAELTLEVNNQSCKTKMMDFQWFQNYQSPEYISDQQFQNSPTMMPYEGFIGAEDTPLNDFFNDNYSQQRTSPDYSVSEESVDDDDLVIGDLCQMQESEMIDYIISPYNPFSEGHRLPNEFPFISSITDDSPCTIQASELVIDPSITTLIPQTIKEIDVVDNTTQEKVEESNDQAPLRKLETAKCRPKKVAKPRKPRKPRRSNSRANRSIHLWEFLRELLNNGTSSSIQWISKKDGTFRLVNSSAVAKLWGQRKNRQNMTYEKMSRALRYYYEKQILERVPNARLIYKFGNRTKPIVSEDSLSDSSEN